VLGKDRGREEERMSYQDVADQIEDAITARMEEDHWNGGCNTDAYDRMVHAHAAANNITIEEAPGFNYDRWLYDWYHSLEHGLS
jgi:hypothetical protein